MPTLINPDNDGLGDIVDNLNELIGAFDPTLGERYQPSVRGSAAAPSYSFFGDSNTGFYSPTDNEIRISINGSDKYVFTENDTTLNNNLTINGTLTVGSTTTFSSNVNITTSLVVGNNLNGINIQRILDSASRVKRHYFANIG